MSRSSPSDGSTFWKCDACPLGTCLMQGPKITKCVAGMPVRAWWVPATETEYAAATVRIDLRPRQNDPGLPTCATRNSTGETK